MSWEGPRPSRGLEKHTQPSTAFWRLQRGPVGKNQVKVTHAQVPPVSLMKRRTVEKTKGIKSEWGLQFIFRHTQRVGGGQPAPSASPPCIWFNQELLSPDL